MTENKQCEILIRDDGVYILKTENYIFHLDEKTHVEKIGELISENEQLKKVINEADDLIKSHLTNHYKTRWKHICEYYGVDIE